MSRPGSGCHGEANAPVSVAVNSSCPVIVPVSETLTVGAPLPKCNCPVAETARPAVPSCTFSVGKVIAGVPSVRGADLSTGEPRDRPRSRTAHRSREVGVGALAEQPQAFRHDGCIEGTVAARQPAKGQISPRRRRRAGQLDEAAVEPGRGLLRHDTTEADAREGVRPVDRSRDRRDAARAGDRRQAEQVLVGRCGAWCVARRITRIGRRGSRHRRVGPQPVVRIDRYTERTRR